ncbi:MAG: tetratricopeptide repeat protein [Deltaproteobacteria bacterium]|nr:tetratricopeptide repeat protein [Deltaproteobacteria bacterium]
MKTRSKQTGILPIFIAAAMWMTGCAASARQEADSQLKSLEKQVMQLKAENANLQARTRELDDKILLYEKKQALNGQKKAHDNMRTVRLVPEAEMGAPVDDEESSVSFRERFDDSDNVDAARDDDKRPVLKLNESALAAYQASGSIQGDVPTTNPRGPSVPRPWNDVPLTNRGDNLGVLSSDGQLQQAEEDSMALFNAAYRSYNNQDYASALAGFSTFLQRESNHRFADNAMFWIAECYLAQGKQLKAVGEFERLLHRYPRSEQAASSLYRIGYVYDQMNDFDRAREYYFKVVEKYPGSEAARKASKRMAENNGSARLVRTSAKR